MAGRESESTHREGEAPGFVSPAEKYLSSLIKGVLFHTAFFLHLINSMLFYLTCVGIFQPEHNPREFHLLSHGCKLSIILFVIFTLNNSLYTVDWLKEAKGHQIIEKFLVTYSGVSF